MIYVLEGPNYVGKTTAALALSAEYAIPIFKDPGRHGFFGDLSPRDWVVRGIQHCLDLAVVSQWEDFIVDRWTLASTVYDRRRGVSWPDGTLERILEEAKAQVVLLRARPEVLLSRSRGDRPRVDSLEHLRELTEDYDRAADQFLAAGGQLRVVDANGSAEEVVDALRADW